MARRRKWEGWSAQAIAQARSQSAKKGWITRRINYVKQGRMTVTEWEDIYGTSIGELTNIFDEYTTTTDFGWVNPKTGEFIESGKAQSEPDPYDESGYQDWDRDDYSYQNDYDDEYPNILDITDDFIIERLSAFANTTNLGSAALTELQNIRSENEGDYYKRIAEHQGTIQTILDDGDLDYNTQETAVLLGELINLVSGGAISSNEFQLKNKQAKRDDSYHMYHKRHPNAKYGKRRTGGFYKS